MKGKHPADPRGLIQEAYNIEAITEAECRSIFFDWVFGIADGEELARLIAELHEHFAADYPAHPMTDILVEGLAAENSQGDRRRRKRRRRKI